MDRLSSIDASFLTNETSSAHMHVGAILIFEGPPPGYEDFLAHVRALVEDEKRADEEALAEARGDAPTQEAHDEEPF